MPLPWPTKRMATTPGAPPPPPDTWMGAVDPMTLADLMALLATVPQWPGAMWTPTDGGQSSPFTGSPPPPPPPGTPPPPVPGTGAPPPTSPFLMPWEAWRVGTPPYTYSPAPVNQQLV